jgi:salicylate biosynthesis isochorismate synthase/menaquinone-specific isochorismate synthase
VALPTTAQRPPFELSEPDRERLERHVAAAAQRARRSGKAAIAAVTVALEPTIDPSAVAFASRAGSEPWMCLEQPARAGAALATLGSIATLEASGPRRFDVVAARWRQLVAEAVCDPADGPRGAGLIASGGFAFADDGGASAPWAGFAPASLVVPEVALARRVADGAADVRMTLAATVAPDDLVEEVIARLQRRVAALHESPLPLVDPAPTGRSHVGGPLAPEHYEAAVARAVALIRGGELEKLVLAREVDVHAPRPHDAAAVFAVLREEFAGCFVFCVGRGESTFIAASPELLIRREGLRASTLALAGSTRRSADPAVDDHLGEQLLRSHKDREEHAIVARRIERTLSRHAVWISAAPEPELVRIANIQHLGTPIRAQLADLVGAIELAGMLHPTPAVGAEPRERGLALIPALEGIDRGWYAGPIGWVDANDDGEFCVALRCALLRGEVARCYAGVGVVADSDPAAELAETEVKLQALLPLLAG